LDKLGFEMLTYKCIHHPMYWCIYPCKYRIF